MVDAALAATGRAQQRVRQLPARVVVYLLLAGCLFAELGYHEVWQKLTAGLGELAVATPTQSALWQARVRMGVAPLRWLFDLLRGPAAAFTAGGVRWCGLLVCAIDGTTMSLPDSARNLAVYAKHAGNHGGSGYPLLHGILTQPATTVWSAASIVANESTDLIWPRLTGTEPGTCRFAAEPAAVKAGLCHPAFTYHSPALVDGDSLAYLTLRGPDPKATQRRWELGATGHGPATAPLAERLCEQIRAWDRDRTAQPTITAYPRQPPQTTNWRTGWSSTSGFVRLVVSV